MILKLFSKEKLWKEIMRREAFGEIEAIIEATTVWRSVFNRTPELSDYLKKRQINLLKANALGDKPSQFVLGQISENMLWQRFDTVPVRKEVEAPKKVKKLHTLHEFLTKVKQIGMTNKVED